jgi:hypothetical protein
MNTELWKTTEFKDALKELIERVEKGEVEALGSATFPTVWRPGCMLAPGLHLMEGAGKSGKTVNAVSLKIALEASGIPNAYRNVMEPRGMLIGVQKVTKPVMQGGITVGETQTEHDNYQTWLQEELSVLNKMKNLSEPHYPVLILDSGTYLIKRLDVTKASLKDDKGAIYQGGLSYGDILGCLHHCLLAAESEVALVMTINSELLPIVDVLGGAIEGLIKSKGPGKLDVESRDTGRRTMAITLPPSAVRCAINNVLKYPPELKGGTAQGDGIFRM